MRNILRELCETNGASGRETAVRDRIIELIRDHCDYRVDALGNIIAFKKGEKAPEKRIMVDAHMDEVGFIATYITESGLINFATVGGINTECILSQRVVFENGTVGVIGGKPTHLLSAEAKKKLPEVDSLYIDIGARDRAEAERYVSLGDTAVFCSPYTEQGDIITARAIDDRAGCAALIKLLREDSVYDFYATFSVQEEVGTRGAATAAFAVAPDFCLCLEATTACDIEGAEGAKNVCFLNCGPIISFMDRGTLYDRELFNAANASAIPHQIKTAVAGGNNSAAIHKSRDGVRTLAISTPCRYLHSASCMSSYSDIEGAYALAKEMISVIGGMSDD
ncbi:MAG: M42 family peptidase [Clostridia bacterium]|nr:M42 family peptidase [Clostridia bacterium]